MLVTIGTWRELQFNFVDSGENSVVWPLCQSYFWHLLVGTMCVSVFYERKYFFLFNFDFWSDCCDYIWRRLPYLVFEIKTFNTTWSQIIFYGVKPRNINQPSLRKINTQFYFFFCKCRCTGYIVIWSSLHLNQLNIDK